MSGHSDGANTADQLRDLIRENQRLTAQLRRRDGALAAVRELAERLERQSPNVTLNSGSFYSTGSYVADRIRAVLAAHTEQATEAGA